MVHLLEDPLLRNRHGVFRDRSDAGKRLAAFMHDHTPLENPLICTIPSGGVPVGLELAKGFHATMFLGVVRKLKVPWNPEAGFGSMTWNGKVYLNRELVRYLNISDDEIQRAVTETRESIRKRIEQFTGGQSLPPIPGRIIIITDDGLASGYTMMAAVEAIRAEEPGKIIIAVPTGSSRAVAVLSGMVDTLVCLNLREHASFAVADAYQFWHDLDDDEVIRSLAFAQKNQLMEGIPGKEGH
ncbi:MAG: phosphoribosyltransferase [Methanoregulaceae archaeon]|nr:phosphoribosyltransferase [Methanoregulaceae archaeon]